MDKNIGAIAQTDPADEKKYQKLSTFFDNVIQGILLGTVFLVPILVFPWATDKIELHKQTLFVLLMSVGIVAWIGKAIVERKVTITRSWLHLITLGFIVGYAIVSWFSIDRFLSFAGHIGQYQWSVVSLVGFGLLYFLTTQTVREENKWIKILFVFLLSSGVVALLSLLQLFGVPIFSWIGDVGNEITFNTIGNINSLAIFLAVALLVATSLLASNRSGSQIIPFGRVGVILVSVVLAFALAIAIIVDFWVVWAMLLFGSFLLVFSSSIRFRHQSQTRRLLFPVSIFVLSLLFLFIKTPIHLEIGSEVSPSFTATWSIARNALQEQPLTGSGPGTWMHDYAKFRSVAVNMSPYWTIRFERGISGFFTFVASIGLIGISLWLILVISGVSKSIIHLVTESSDKRWLMYQASSVGWATVVFAFFIYNYNVSHQFVFWFFFALIASLVTRSRLTWDTRKSAVHSSILSIIFLVLIAGVVSGVWLLSQRYVSEIYTYTALRAHDNGAPIGYVADTLVTSLQLNPWNDVSARNISQAGLIQIQNELSGPADDNKNTRINDAVKKTVLAAQSAVNIAPANVQNWANFGMILRTIASFTPGADEQAILMYREALLREPKNPVFWNEIGELYILRADAFATLLQSTDQDVITKTHENIDTQLHEALLALNQAIAVKSDFATALYNIALVNERQGKTAEAILRLEQIMNADSNDKGIAFQLGILYYRNNELDKAKNIFEGLVAFNPNYSNARWYLSAVYENEGRYEEAIEQVKKVEEANPDNATILERLATLTALRDGNGGVSTEKVPFPVIEEIKTPSDSMNIVQ